MDKELLVHEILARAFLDIRVASHDDHPRVCFEISDLFHNVPYQLARLRKEKGDFSEIINWLRDRAEKKQMTSYLEHIISECRLP